MLPDAEGRRLAAAELASGKLVTISFNKSIGDRSLSQAIWEVVSTNDGHALVRCRTSPTCSMAGR